MQNFIWIHDIQTSSHLGCHQQSHLIRIFNNNTFKTFVTNIIIISHDLKMIISINIIIRLISPCISANPEINIEQEKAKTMIFTILI